MGLFDPNAGTKTVERSLACGLEFVAADPGRSNGCAGSRGVPRRRFGRELCSKVVDRRVSRHRVDQVASWNWFSKRNFGEQSRLTVSKDTRADGGEQAQIARRLDELARIGARQVIEQAVQLALRQLLESYENVCLGVVSQ